MVEKAEERAPESAERAMGTAEPEVVASRQASFSTSQIIPRISHTTNAKTWMGRRWINFTARTKVVHRGTYGPPSGRKALVLGRPDGGL